MSPTTTPASASGGTNPSPSDAPPLETLFKGNRPAAAAALLILLELVPAAGLIVALREGVGIWIIFTCVLAGGGLVPPVGVAMGRRWGYALGQYVVWGSLVGVVLRVLHSGFTLIYLPPAMLLGVLLVALSPPRGAREAGTMERKPESFGVWCKENIEAIIVAFIMALVIRCFCIEVFKIPSSSMEPTLLGDLSSNHRRESCPFSDYHVPLNTDSASGDRIMVTKYFYSFSPVERFDVIVFKFPLNQAKNFIKRVVGLPDEQIRIYHGNLYVKKPGEEKFKIARRTLRTQDSIWIDPAKNTDGYLTRYKDFKDAWDTGPVADRKKHAEPVVAEGELSTQEKDGERSVEFSYRARTLNDAAGRDVDDMRIAFEVEITSPKGQVYAEVVNSYGRFEARFDTEGESQLRFHKPGSEKGPPTDIVPLKDVHLSMDRRIKVDLSIFDGMAYVRVNDGERARLPFIETREDVRENDTPDRHITFGARGLTFRARNLALGRDIYYRQPQHERALNLHEDEVETIPPQHYLMMGDNVANSHDSRAWVMHTFHLKDGKTVVCEEQQVTRSYSTDLQKRLQDRYNLPRPPDIAIDGDEHGNEVPIFDSDIESQSTEKYRFVHEKFIVGKALWIWWPQGRWFHLIR
ncbi:MAG TPA: signal peptidase I [Planctomycetota bacterium]|nr:signal peptidase I [Planctomycetota bacterium]